MTTGHPAFYRPNVGLMLIAADRRIFVGQRTNQPDQKTHRDPQQGINDRAA